MQNNMYEVVDVLKKVFKKGSYILLTFAVTVGFYILTALVTNIGNVFYNFKNFSFVTAFSLSSLILTSFWRTILPSSVVSILLLGFFTGILVSLLTYRYRTIQVSAGRVGVIASIGLFLGVLAPGCAVCGIGLIGILGLGSSLAFLPFKGAEVSYLGMAIIIFVIIRVSRQIANASSCEIPIYKMKGGLYNGKRNKS